MLARTGLIPLEAGSMPLRCFVFVHMFAGHKRTGDLEWWLVKLCEQNQINHIVHSFDCDQQC